MLHAPTTQAKGTCLFIDRFANIYFHDQCLELGEIIPALAQEKTTKNEITIIYEPYTLESDIKLIEDILKRDFPERHLTLRKIEKGDNETRLSFPLHRPSVQNEAISQRNSTWEELFSRHEQLLDQLRFYMANVSAQMTKTRADLSAIHQEYQHLTMPNSGKPFKSR
ncbi:MAG: hypothetical protein WC975_05770 [Phycisphaerae bacterium]